MNPAAGLVERLAGFGLGWDSLIRNTEAVVLFGSRAMDCERADSDWDLLCVGGGQTRLVRGLDIVWIDARRSTNPNGGWVGSELANHIARFGLVLAGELPWTEDHGRNELALARKRRQLDGHVAGMLRVWPMLNSAFRNRQLTALRRELQRYELLAAAESVPPTAMLDRAWDCDATPAKLRLWELLERAGIPSSTVPTA